MKRSSLLFYIPPPLIAGIAIGVWQYLQHQPAQDAPPEPTDKAPAAVQPKDEPGPVAAVRPPAAAPVTPQPSAPATPPPPVTTLAEANALFPELANQIFPPERIAEWLKQSDLLRRIVAVTDCLANGTSPKGQLTFLAPTEPYRAEAGRDRRWYASAANALRTRATIETFCHANPQAVAAAYTRLEPVFDQLYHDIGYPDAKFRDALALACRVLLTTPVPEQEPALTHSGTLYYYADPKLEELYPAQKHLLRLGVDDARRVQKQIMAIAQAMQLKLN